LFVSIVARLLPTRSARLLVWPLLIALLGWALKDVRPVDVAAIVARLTPTSILALVAVNAAILWLFSSRWWLILRAQGYRIQYLSLVSYRLAAFGVSYFTPGPQFGGEPLQAYFLHKRHNVPLSSAISSITLDKLFELLANFGFLIFGILTIIRSGFFPGLPAERLIPMAVLLLLAPAAYLTALWAGFKPLVYTWERLPVRILQIRSVSQFQEHIEQVEQQIADFCRQRPKALVQAILISAFIWVILVLEYQLTLNYLDIELNLFQSIAVLTAARMAFLLPMPGGVGALEASLVLAMQAMGNSPAAGISVGILIRVRDVFLGASGLWLAMILSRRKFIYLFPSQAGD
jgi:uncharacterized protein (TIRG00374 family)